jgi:hypothetical protein
VHYYDDELTPVIASSLKKRAPGCPMYWTRRFLNVIGAARNTVSSAGQSSPSPMNELVPTQWFGIKAAVREFVGDLTAFARFHGPAKDSDRFTSGAKSLGNCVEVIDPSGQDQDVGAAGGRR